MAAPELPRGGIGGIGPAREADDEGVGGPVDGRVGGEAEDIGARGAFGTALGIGEGGGGSRHEAAEAAAVGEGAVVEARGLGPLVVVEDVRALAAEA